MRVPTWWYPPGGRLPTPRGGVTDCEFLVGSWVRGFKGGQTLCFWGHPGVGYPTLVHSCPCPWGGTRVCRVPPGRDPGTLKSMSNRADHKTCIRDGTGTTGEGFKSLFNFAKSARPALIIAENVKQVEDHGEGQFMCDELESIGYMTHCVLVEAMEYGSPLPRNRWYMVAVLIGTTKDFSELRPIFGNKLDATLRRMSIDALPIAKFIVEDPEEAQTFAEEHGFPREHERVSKDSARRARSAPTLPVLARNLSHPWSHVSVFSMGYGDG